MHAFVCACVRAIRTGIALPQEEVKRFIVQHLRDASKQVQMSQARVAYSRELTKALHPTQMELELPLALAGTRKPGLVARVSHRRWQKEADGGGALFPPERPIDGTAYVDVEYSLEGSEEDLEVCARMLARAHVRDARLVLDGRALTGGTTGGGRRRSALRRAL
jgi:hypothetical protein